MSPEELELLQSTVAINQYLSAEKTREILADLEHKKPFELQGTVSLYSICGTPAEKAGNGYFRQFVSNTGQYPQEEKTPDPIWTV